MRIPILTYHSLDTTGSVISTCPDDFRRQMESLHNRGYTGIRLGDLLDAWEGKAILPSRPVVLTFDDAFTNVLEVAAPILAELGYRATVFAVSGYCGLYNDWGQPAGIPRLPLLSWSGLHELASAGLEIGSHTITHASLPDLSDTQALHEIVESKHAFEEALGQPFTLFAYPYGHFRRAHQDMAAAHYRAACGTYLGHAHADENRHRLSRIDMFYFRNHSLFRSLDTIWGKAYLKVRAVPRACRTVFSSSPIRFGRHNGEIKETNNADYCCPQCHGELQSSPKAYQCAPCKKTYPIFFGIPDFRIRPDPYLNIEEDRRKAEQIAEQYTKTNFAGLLNFYWSITPGTPRDLAQRYINHALTGIHRGRHLLDAIQAAAPYPVLTSDSSILEMGCGTGGILVAAAPHFGQTVGIDIALRWLIIAKKQLEEQNISARLVCCCAEKLPFRASLFDLVVAANVIEHTRAPADLIQESYDVLRPRGVFFATTWNRYTPAPEPHVRLWGVGWLPRKWMNAYVRGLRGVTYDNIRLVSFFELKRLVRNTAFGRCRIELPAISDREQDGLSLFGKRLVALYHQSKGWPVIASLLRLFAPILQVVCVKDNRVQNDC